MIHIFSPVRPKQPTVIQQMINIQRTCTQMGLTEQAMSKFTLHGSLGKEPPTKKSSIEYQQYFVECEDSEIEILVPLRECVAFEQSLQAYDTSRTALRGLLRKHRAVREQ